MSQRPDHFANLDQILPHLSDFVPRLVDWGRWCKGPSGAGGTSPGFRGYKSPSVMDRPVPTPAPLEKDAVAVERIVATLPEMHRSMLRAWYVFRQHPMQLCRAHRVKPQDLCRVLNDARTMARSRFNASRVPVSAKTALFTM